MEERAHMSHQCGRYKDQSAIRTIRSKIISFSTKRMTKIFNKLGGHGSKEFSVVSG